MNQARSTYQSDYAPFDWLQNNFTSDVNEFCSPENVDECLKYISQEFCALGYPSIYPSSSDCQFAVNCDIVKLLNATFELLRSCNEQTQIKEDLESRNQRFSVDLSILNKKNGQLKNSLEQNERKLAFALERERQLKEKNEQLSQSLKAEKDETKRLAAQIQQQKIAYQHEYRKYENNINHIKAKVNQLLSDKKANKKIASITTSQTLLRNTGQRGKWKTGSTATSAVEDMYNSIVSDYEKHSKEQIKEIEAYHNFLQSVLLQTLEIVSDLKGDDAEETDTATSEKFLLDAIKNESRDIQSFDDKFKYLLFVLRKFASKEVSNRKESLAEEVSLLKSKPQCKNALLMCQELQKLEENQERIPSPEPSKREVAQLTQDEILKSEMKKLIDHKLALTKVLENVQKEQKPEVTAKRMAFLKVAMQQKNPTSVWHQGLSNLPTISVITSRDGTSRIPNTNVLKSCSSSPDQIGQSPPPPPLYKLNDQARDNLLHSKSESLLMTGDNSVSPSNLYPFQPANMEFSNSDLPSWAVNTSETQSIFISETLATTSESSRNVPQEDVELPSEPSLEEINLSRLKAAVKDMEERRTNIS